MTLDSLKDVGVQDIEPLMFQSMQSRSTSPWSYLTQKSADLRFILLI